ncbi:hypothetical protein [Ornithinimicrobium tianjinense]|uniref:Uncharacterized protein n=1 Tax=Ornithinimicrobium tianjinense TaxID=1195761 RepID=A0A917F3F1_9MICO|nr:hypothetical protein [Ornithinimicrobium tianjinense]GGF49134.1 hypothetical protein GCM10011366_16280 [Ornithinimicrobium tianjinense]
MIRIPVDFNARAHDGLVVASMRRIQGEVQVGDEVLADAREDEMVYMARVVEIDGRKVYLDVDWTRNLAQEPLTVLLMSAAPSLSRGTTTTTLTPVPMRYTPVHHTVRLHVPA